MYHLIDSREQSIKSAYMLELASLKARNITNLDLIQTSYHPLNTLIDIATDIIGVEDMDDTYAPGLQMESRKGGTHINTLQSGDSNKDEDGPGSISSRYSTIVQNDDRDSEKDSDQASIAGSRASSHCSNEGNSRESVISMESK